MSERGDWLFRLHRVLPPAGSAAAFVVCALVVLAAGFAKPGLETWGGEPLPPYITFYPAVVVAALIGGARFGVLAAIATTLVAWVLWVAPEAPLSLADRGSALSGGIYTITSIAIALIVGTARLAVDRAAAGENERSSAARESVHRIKNLIAVVQAISNKVAREVDTVEAFREKLGARLAGLDIAQNVLVRRDWVDAPLEEIIQSTLAPFLPNPGLAFTPGTPVLVPARYVSGLSMALYELCTNAMKYGALADGKGPVALSWACDEGECALRWDEGARPGAGQSKRSGFGTQLINIALSRDPGTSVKYDVSETGVRAEFRWRLKPL